jgi:hypothetical protein
MTKTCSQRCVDYLKRHPDMWIASGHMQRLGAQNSTYTPATIARQLRELAQVGEIEVEIRKGHAHYRYTGGSEAKRLQALQFFEAL